jgi:predicted dehydrogenase
MSPKNYNNIASDDSNTNIKWGIIGLGDVCQKKSGPAFWKCDGSDLVAVMRRTPGKAKEFATQVPGGNCVGYEDIESFLKHPGLQAVYVSTRPGTHLEICQKVCEAGKICYVEKPVGRCSAETEKIHKLYEANGIKLYTAYISRAYERTQKVRELLSSGVIGDTVQKVTYNLAGTGGARDMTSSDLPWRLNATESGGGLIMDVGCHVLDRIDYLCGPLINLKGNAENKNSPNIPVEDHVHLTADISSDARWAALPPAKDATVECTWDFNPKDKDPVDELQIVGPKGAIRMAGMSPNGPVKVYDEKGALQQEFQFDMPEHTAQNLIQAITNDLRGIEPSDHVLSFGDDAIRTQRVIDTVLNSYYGGREIGFWTRPTAWPRRPSQSLT